MRIVIAPQALKGSLDARAVGQAIARGVLSVWADAEVHIVPVADGGEGTVRALVAATEGELRVAVVHGPLGSPVRAEYGILGASPAAPAGRSAIIEMAAASGLTLVPPAQRDPRRTSTAGTGELMRAALDAGCDTLLIGLGGSATNDGGAGMAQALGVHLLDADGHELPPGGAALARLAHVDCGALDGRLARTRMRVAADVNNPLCGPGGATAVYGPQKGATPAVVEELDAALAHYAQVLRDDLGVAVADVPGAGAAGGLGAGLLAFTPAELVPGAWLVLEALQFGELLRGARLVFTAEGQLDAQTAYGKAVGAVAAAARQAGAHVIALTGRLAADDMLLAQLGIDVALPICDGPQTVEDAMRRAPGLVADTAARALRLVALGRDLR